MNLKTCFLILAYVLSTEGIISAAPSLPVTKAPVTPNTSFTGPTNDAHAVMGQWVMNVDTSKREYRTHEFYDNISGSGGGSAGHLAIYGVVTNIGYDENIPVDPPIISFKVIATVSNDTPASPAWSSGLNSHGEGVSTSQQYSNTLRNVILTADFAYEGTSIPTVEPPYQNITSPYITATNHDFLTWYCWNENTNVNQHGDFHVPGWNFGDIAPGAKSTKTLHFIVTTDGFSPTGIPIGSQRYIAIKESETSGADIFINRSLSLKISEWISDPALDEGDGAATNSNVSVFHNTDADMNQVVAIAGIKTETSPLSFTVYTTGSTNGISQQIMQVSTNLMTTNWMNIATNEAAWPIPQTNSWSHTNNAWPVQFYRIIQP
jgi:hypothetical protein